jgi:hypothetical protein
MDFHIRGRIDHSSGSLHYRATVVASPSAGLERWIGNSLTESSATYLSALAALQRLSVEMGRRIRVRGDNVISVDLEES